MRSIIFTCIAAVLIINCKGKTTDSNVEAPGAEKSEKTVMLETGADML